MRPSITHGFFFFKVQQFFFFPGKITGIKKIERSFPKKPLQEVNKFALAATETCPPSASGGLVDTWLTGYIARNLGAREISFTGND